MREHVADEFGGRVVSDDVGQSDLQVDYQEDLERILSALGD